MSLDTGKVMACVSLVSLDTGKAMALCVTSVTKHRQGNSVVCY